MLEGLEDTTPITPPGSITAPSAAPVLTPPAAAATAPAAPTVAEEPEAEEAAEKKPTVYVVLAGRSKQGPWERLGGEDRTFEGHGQTAAKKAAVAALVENGTDANEFWFLAIPASSYVPESPQVKTTTVVSF